MYKYFSIIIDKRFILKLSFYTESKNIFTDSALRILLQKLKVFMTDR